MIPVKAILKNRLRGYGLAEKKNTLSNPKTEEGENNKH
jgi:hypothetical protein